MDIFLLMAFIFLISSVSVVIVVIFFILCSFLFFLVANKVALLIGNKDYGHQQLGKLFHPINDVCDFTGRLINMGFKVSNKTTLFLKL